MAAGAQTRTPILPLDLIQISPLGILPGRDYVEQLHAAEAQIKLAEAAPKLLQALQIAQRHLACIAETLVATTTCADAAKLARAAIIEAGAKP